MKPIIKFKANDGSEWNTEEDALLRDEMIVKVAAVMAPLGTTPKAVDEGKGWVHHNLATVTKCKQGILDLCKPTYGKHYKAFFEPAAKVHAMSIVGRILSEDDGPLGYAWNRFSRIDEEGREHQQCYYAYGGGKRAEHVCIEDRR